MINPADGLMELPENTVALGKEKLARFSKLKISARNCKFILSDSFVLLNSDVSKPTKPGPFRTPRPKFPQVPATGSIYAFGSNQRVGVPSLLGPEKAGLSEGRSGIRVSPLPEMLAPINGVMGKPPKAETI